ncbi:hypothetical protein J4Q44_G00313580 [Coregonus suidteri]|uniref:C3H1-type domain-containing protein n=1 Tax=Coregonus suidteri TaxID=861788 RepID=A0AAN8KUZ5_9TELE
MPRGPTPNTETKEKYGKECKICSLPFTVFRWCPGMRRRFKKTEVCQTWSMVRDTGLDIKDDVPKSDGILTRHGWWVSFVRPPAPVRCCLSWPYYKRNRLHICSFWVKGEWKRGEECPYRHERPTDPDDLLADQNIKDRYYGINDPVADKLLKRASTMPQLDTPEDKTITTLYVGGLGDTISGAELRNHFYQFGEIWTTTIVQKQKPSSSLPHGRRLSLPLGSPSTSSSSTDAGSPSSRAGPRQPEGRRPSKTGSVRWEPDWTLYQDCLELSPHLLLWKSTLLLTTSTWSLVSVSPLSCDG